VRYIAKQVRGNLSDVVSKQITGHSADTAADGYQGITDGCAINDSLLDYYGVE